MCVCPFTKCINYFTHYLFIKLICMKCSVLADGYEDSKNHLSMQESRLQRRWPGVSQGHGRSNRGSLLSRGQKPVDSNALPSFHRREQFYKLFSLWSSLRRIPEFNPLPTSLASSCVQPPLVKAVFLKHQQTVSCRFFILSLPAPHFCP